MEVMWSVHGQSWVVVHASIFVMCRSMYLPIVMYCEVCCCLHIKCNILTQECTLSQSVFEVSDTYQLECLRYREKHGRDILISCGFVLLFTNM